LAKSKSKHKKERKHTRTVFGRKTLKLHGGELELRYKGRKRVILRIPTRKTRKGKVKKLKSKRIAVEGEVWEVVDRKTGQTYRYVVNTVDFKRDAKRHALPPEAMERVRKANRSLVAYVRAKMEGLREYINTGHADSKPMYTDRKLSKEAEQWASNARGDQKYVGSASKLGDMLAISLPAGPARLPGGRVVSFCPGATPACSATCYASTSSGSYVASRTSRLTRAPTCTPARPPRGGGRPRWATLGVATPLSARARLPSGTTGAREAGCTGRRVVSAACV